MGGSSEPVYAAGVSGAGGGRILPGSASGRLYVNFSSSNFDLLASYGEPGGGPGQVGTSGTNPGGGGWGAAGGTAISGLKLDGVTPAGPNGIGGAGGKAINTNGFAVTFTGGSNRVYGVVG